MKRSIILVSLALIYVNANAGPVEVPNTFVADQKANAEEVNANFSAVEAAVNDNDQRINRNAAELAVVTTEIQALQVRAPVAVFDGVGNELGRMISGIVGNDGPGRITVLTLEGYNFILSLGDGGVVQATESVYYATDNCSGPLYTYRSAGIVFRNSVDTALYYVDRDSTPSSVAVTEGSFFDETGGCVLTYFRTPSWVALPNDPVVTGVSDLPYTLPIKMGQF